MTAPNDPKPRSPHWIEEALTDHEIAAEYTAERARQERLLSDPKPTDTACRIERHRRFMGRAIWFVLLVLASLIAFAQSIEVPQWH